MRLLTARWTPDLPPLCNDDTRIKLGKERGPNAERLCSSYEATLLWEKAAIACLCTERKKCPSGAVRCSSVHCPGWAGECDETREKESSFTHLAKRPGVGSRSTPRWRWRAWRDVPHRERFVTFVGRIAGKCQQNAASETEAGLGGGALVAPQSRLSGQD